MAEVLRKFNELKKSAKKSDQKQQSSCDVYLKPSPLRNVVAQCEKHWYEQTLKGAQNGDVAMQTLVGQMLCSGYGVAVNVKEVYQFYNICRDSLHCMKI